MGADGESDTGPSSPGRKAATASQSSAEALSTGRSRRATAGNRMRELLEQERERMIAEGEDESEGDKARKDSAERRRRTDGAAAAAEEDEDAMFNEAEGEEDVDFEEKGEIEDIVDSDFDLSSDQGDEDDEEAGERALQEEEKAARKASKAAARSKAIGAPAAPARKSAPIKSALSNASADATNEEKRKSKRISFATADKPDGAERNQRTSKRKSTMRVAETVQARLKEEEERRARHMEKAKPKRKKIRISQADYIAEALEMEDRNRESLKVFFEREEARKERDKKGKKTAIEGPFIRWRSVTVDRANGTQRHTVEVIDSKTGMAKSSQTITLDPVFAAREAAVKARQSREEAARDASGANGDRSAGHSQTQDENGMTQEPSMGHSRTTTASETVTERSIESDLPTAADAKEVESIRQDDSAQLVHTESNAGEQSNGGTKQNSSRPVEINVEKATDLKQMDSASHARSPSESGNQEAGVKQSVDSSVKGEALTCNGFAETSVSAVVGPAAGLPVMSEWEARAYVSLHGLPPSTPWPVWFGHILGEHVDWASYPVVPARNRPLRPRQSVCPITGLPAKYRDPRSGVPFANVEAFANLTRVMEGQFRWSGGVGSDQPSRATKAPVVPHYDPLEMGCFFDALDETGANDVLLLSSTASTNGSTSSRTLNGSSKFDYRPRNALAPGDEKAVIAAAEALPAGSTRSGGRRSAVKG